MFTKAITRTPSKSMIHGITSASLGKPIYELALKQHKNYITALAQCGMDVTVLEADETYPDATFVEDTALLTPHCAIITNPGALSRQGEIGRVAEVVGQFYDNVAQIEAPGTVEGGDIMMVGSHFYVGLSERTNQAGADQVIEILNKYGLTGSVVPLKEVLHLKTGVVYLENNNLLAHGEFLQTPDFQQYNILKVDDAESYAANCIWVNGTVIVPAGYPKTKQTIENAGYPTLSVDVSEFRKLDGGLSCLSLRF
ncbi:MAG: N(G),N(G)-dimethylarginine dimethylaminohydrolase [Chloroflexi bacterium]|nr:MAG: N(G),N(G)-dimethylarginine dimethylaminohydrolase [Chloroflexota bacterium]